jgi:hypothetical protein
MFYGEANLTNRIEFGVVSPRITYHEVSKLNEAEGNVLRVDGFTTRPATATMDPGSLNPAAIASETRVLSFEIGAASQNDVLSRITIKDVPVLRVLRYTGRFSAEDVSLVGRIARGNTHFVDQDGGARDRHVQFIPTVANGRFPDFGLKFTNMTTPVSATHEPNLPVIEFIWQTGDPTFETYKINGGPEVTIDQDKYPVLPFRRNGSWYVPVRLFAEMLGVEDRNIEATFDENGKVDGAQIRVDAVGVRISLFIGSAEAIAWDILGPRYVFLEDANGAPVEVWNEDGRIFVPLRGLLQMLGLTVEHVPAVDGVEGALINAR